MEKAGQQAGHSCQPAQCRTSESPEHVVHVAAPKGGVLRLRGCRAVWGRETGCPGAAPAYRPRWSPSAGCSGRPDPRLCVCVRWGEGLCAYAPVRRAPLLRGFGARPGCKKAPGGLWAAGDSEAP